MAVVSLTVTSEALAGNPLGLTRWEWPATLGQRATTGPDGIAALPAGDAPWLCSASADGGFAFAMVPPRNRTQTLALCCGSRRHGLRIFTAHKGNSK